MVMRPFHSPFSKEGYRGILVGAAHSTPRDAGLSGPQTQKQGANLCILGQAAKHFALAISGEKFDFSDRNSFELGSFFLDNGQ